MYIEIILTIIVAILLFFLFEIIKLRKIFFSNNNNNVKELFSVEKINDKKLLQEARKIVINTGRASASFLQRVLRIGYGKASELLDLLEEEGVIGPRNGSEPRVVLKNKK